MKTQWDGWLWDSARKTSTHSLLCIILVVALSSHTRTLREDFWCINPFFFSSPFFFVQWRSAHAHQLHSFNHSQSTLAQWAETTVAAHSLRSCMLAHFPGRFSHYAYWVLRKVQLDIIIWPLHSIPTFNELPCGVKFSKWALLVRITHLEDSSLLGNFH